MKKTFKLTGLFFLGLILFVTCKEETPAPTASFTFTVEGNVVTFTAVVTNDNKYEWDFGDGSYISTIHNPTHTYSEYGKDFTVSLTIIGDGGQVTVTNVVTIPPKTKMQLLTGGKVATSSKKWRISSSGDIIFAIPDASLTAAKSFPAGTFNMIGLAAAYTDEYIFYGNGNLAISPKGGGVMAGYVYCAINGVAMAPDAGAKSAGLAYAKPFTPPAGATFTVNEGKNLVVVTSLNGVTTTDVTYNNVMTLSFTNNGFIGIKDFMSECIVQELTDTRMKVAFFISAVPPPAPQIGKITNVMIVSFEVAP